MYTILVPQGAEYRAVWRGCKSGMADDGAGQVQVVPIAIGSSMIHQQLTRLLQTGTIPQASQVIVMGLCGSLSPEYRVGDGVIYHTCVSGTSRLVCDPTLTATLKNWLPSETCHLTPVTCHTSDRLLWSATEKQKLGEVTEAAVVDMEGSTILEVLGAAGLAVAMVRVVSDGVEQDLPDLTTAMGTDGSLRPGSLGLAMIRQPIAALHLIRSSLYSLRRLQAIAAIVAKAVSARHLPDS